jgi:glutathione S-transferase
LTIADITALVAVEFLRIVKHPIPEGYTNLLAWLERMRARPSTAM